jgi:tetratricopeptide (TPR) repeat protein
MYKEVGKAQASPYSLPPFVELPQPHSSPLPMSQIVPEDPLESEIRRYREQLAACPTTHPQRGNACHDLGTSLYRSWVVTPTTALLEEAITLHREAFALRPDGHPDHAASCNSLGGTLVRRYEVTGDQDLLEEIIKLHYKAIALHPDGHLDRATSCHNLAAALGYRYQVTGGSDLLDEVIKLHREALALRPGGHRDRSRSCANLAIQLIFRYHVTGSFDLLDEAITLCREALALKPAGHPRRTSSCNTLAGALQERYSVTGSSDDLDEAITLHREALAELSDAHPDRWHSCNNLAIVLYDRYQVTGSFDLLDEATTLYREALALQPETHPDRAGLCNNLANALQDRYQVMGSADLLNETIKLNREALALRPHGHPFHALSCNAMADTLWKHFGQTKDVTVIDEALALARETVTSGPPSDLWRASLILCLIHTEQASPHFSISTATTHLLQASVSLPPMITEFMRDMQSRLDRMWLVHGTWTPDTPLSLLEVYSNVIDGLSKMTGFAVDTVSQLTALRSARSFGSDACVAALLSGRPRQAIELIDRAHGVVWAQALHQRNPQLQDIPQSVASELEALFRAVSVPVDTHQRASADHATGPEDVRDQQNSRIQTLLTEVRAMPGLERFMLGRTYAQLRRTAREHPAVVLVSARGHVYALIIRDSAQENPEPLRLELTSDRLSLLRDTAAHVGLRNENSPQDVKIQFGRAMHVSKRKETTVLSTLADLWHDIVKPVIDHLQLQVSIYVCLSSSLS